MASQRPGHDNVVDATTETERTMHPQRVPVNVYESTNALVIVAPMPAVTASDVTIELHPALLRFWAKLRSAGPRDYLVHEWEYGGYEREIDIPARYGGGVEASMANGQLVVRVLPGQASGIVVIKPSP